MNTVRLRKRVPMPEALQEARDIIDRETQRPSSLHNRAVDNINITCTQERPTGTSANQALRKLRVDAPSLHGRVLAGELSPLPKALQQIRAFTATTGQPIGAAS